MAVRLKERNDPRLAQIAAVAELKPALAAYAREHGGRFILFGSAARREMRPGSDVDILVDFPAGPHSDAIRFAEDACWRLGLRPDVLAYGWPAGRFLARVNNEGLVLPGDENRWSRPMSTEDRWGDILEAAESAASHFRAAERIFREGGLDGSGDDAYRSRMAFYHAMQSGQTALESALKRSLVALGTEPPTGAQWHKALLAAAAKQTGPTSIRLLPAELAEAAKETLGFRHFASHGYNAPFNPEKARPAVEAGLLIADGIGPTLVAFRRDVNPE